MEKRLKLALSDKDELVFKNCYNANFPLECWVWTGSISCGRGLFPIRVYCKNRGTKRAMAAATRVAWYFEHGSIGDYDFVHQKCKNLLCVNPAHLFLRSGRDMPVRRRDMPAIRSEGFLTGRGKRKAYKPRVKKL